MTEPAIRVTDVHKAFGSTRAVEGASVAVPEGGLVALLGPSGSGKTTLLRMIAGFEVPDEGTVAIGGRTVAGPGTWVEPEDRRIGMVFQDGALFPHLTVEANVGFGEPAPGRVDECLDLVGLGERASAYPHELSGGERQRVALARALATDPEVVLLDEPFASLDAGLRVALREDVAAILREAGASALLVTHDQQEALSLADEVVVLRRGRVEQAGSPEHLYAHPTSRWVAEFLGAAEVVAGTSSGGTVECELGRFPAPAGSDGPVEVVVRPEAFVLEPVGADEGERGPAPGGAGSGATTSDDTGSGGAGSGATGSGDTGSGGAGSGATGSEGAARPADRAAEVAGQQGCSPVGTVEGRSYYGHDQLVRLVLPSGRTVRCRTSGGQAWAAGDRARLRVVGPVTVLPLVPSA